MAALIPDALNPRTTTTKKSILKDQKYREKPKEFMIKVVNNNNEFHELLYMKANSYLAGRVYLSELPG